MTTVKALPDRVAQLDTLVLHSGEHDDADSRMCFNEAVAWLAGEPHTDTPACVPPVLRDFTLHLNDTWDDDARQQLKPFLVRCIGTAGDGQDDARSFLALDWLIRTHTPVWLDVAGLTSHAVALRDLPPITDRASAAAAGGTVHAAGNAAFHAAGYDTRDAADATREAAYHAAWHASWRAAGAAAWAAVRAVRAAVRDTARNATRVAAGDAAKAALAPTVAVLQESALDLLDRMIDPSTASTS